MTVDDIKSWMKEHQVLSLVLLISLLVVAAFLALGLQQTVGSNAMRQEAMGGGASVDLAQKERAPTSQAETDQGGSGGGAYVKVKEGSMDIKTDNARRGADQIRQRLPNYQGYVEESRKYGSSLYTNIKLQVRVPSTGDNFERLLTWLRQNYEVKSYNVKNYRLSTQRELDELSILNKTMADYESIRQEANRMNIGEEKLDMLMRVTEKELTLLEKKKGYERDLSGKQRRSDYATLNIELREKKSVDIGPENIGNRFKNKVKNMLDTIVDILISTLTFGVELFFRVIQLIVYLIIIIIPLALVYRLGKKIYKRYW